MLDITDVATLCNVDRLTVYREIKRGNLKAARVGHLYRIAPADLAAYLDRGR